MNLSEVSSFGAPCGATYATGAGPTAARGYQAPGRQDFRPLMNDMATSRVLGGTIAPVRTAQGLSRGVAGPSRPTSTTSAKETMVEGATTQTGGSHVMSTGEEVTAIIFVLVVLAIVAVAGYFRWKQAELQTQADIAIVQEAGQTARAGLDDVFN